jgi:hypothetical protein
MSRADRAAEELTKFLPFRLGVGRPQAASIASAGSDTKFRSGMVPVLLWRFRSRASPRAIDSSVPSVLDNRRRAPQRDVFSQYRAREMCH